MEGAKLHQHHYAVLNALENLLSGVCSGCRHGHGLAFSFWALKLLLSCPQCEWGQGNFAGVPPASGAL